MDQGRGGADLGISEILLISALFAAIYLSTVGGFLWLLWQQNEKASNERLQMLARAQTERDRLLERIQRPEYIPATSTAIHPDPDPHLEEPGLPLVGGVHPDLQAPGDEKAD